MVNLIVGPKGSGKTQQLIALANEKVKSSNGNVVLIKTSHRDTITVDFNVRTVCMDDYRDIATLEELAGFLYGMAAGNNDIETVLIDSVLKQANITMDNLSVVVQKLNDISSAADIEFYISVGANKEDLPDLDGANCKIL